MRATGDYKVDNSIVSMLCFLNLLIVLWLYKRISLFLKGEGEMKTAQRVTAAREPQ